MYLSSPNQQDRSIRIQNADNQQLQNLMQLMVPRACVIVPYYIQEKAGPTLIKASNTQRRTSLTSLTPLSETPDVQAALGIPFLDEVSLGAGIGRHGRGRSVIILRDVESETKILRQPQNPPPTPRPNHPIQRTYIEENTPPRTEALAYRQESATKSHRSRSIHLPYKAPGRKERGTTGSSLKAV